MSENEGNGASREGFIFLSYKREDAAEADKFRAALEESGFEVWFDENLQCGQKWAKVLDTKLREAACIVVLWSEKANASPWVKHEASHAMAGEVYAPCRIELTVIDPPFNQVQATDMLDWNGNLEHPGFRDFINRVDSLMPIKPKVLVRTKRWMYRQKTVIAAILFSLLTLGLLAWQTYGTSSQLNSMGKLSTQIDKTLVEQEKQILEAQETQKQTKRLADPLDIVQKDISSQVTQLKTMKGQMSSTLRQTQQLSAPLLRVKSDISSQVKQMKGIENSVGASVDKQKALLNSTNKIAEDMERSLNPLTQLEFSFSADVELDSKELIPFIERFSKGISEFISDDSKGIIRPLSTFTTMSDKDGPMQITVSLNSPLFPSRSSETSAYYLLRYVDFHLVFYKKPIAPDYFEKNPVSRDKYGDLRININSSEQKGYDYRIAYNVREKKFQVRSSSIKSDPRYWKSNRKISSIPDFVGTQMFIFTESIMVPSLKGDNSNLTAHRSKIQLNNLELNIGGGIEFWFRSGDMQEYLRPNGLRYYVVTLPDGLTKYVR